MIPHRYTHKNYRYTFNCSPIATLTIGFLSLYLHVHVQSVRYGYIYFLFNCFSIAALGVILTIDALSLDLLFEVDRLWIHLKFVTFTISLLL